ncbi:Ger(x)C family spore germination protein [Brassicibacter mesophilus]|uniref:Ger(x)C family spore germination protein n=1 Tax=Brassicibacter mesophilus TaxID=745119 RepID=UPI003D1AC1A9
MTKKYNKLWSLIILTSILLTGCWDYGDIEKKSIVISIGVDRVDDKIEFSTEVAKLIPKMGEEKGKIETSGVYSDVSIGENFEKGRLDYDSKRPYPTFLGATRVVIFSTNYAKESIEPYLNRINNIYDYRKTVLAVVSRESPRELLKTKVENDISVGFFIEDNLNFLSSQGAALYPTIGELLSDIALGEVGYLLPHVGVEQNSVKYLGLAAMKDSRLIDTVNIKDTTGILYILADSPKFTEVMTSTKNPKNKISFLSTIKKRKIKTDYVDGKVVIDLHFDLNSLLQYQYYVEPISDDEIKRLEEMLAEKVKKDIINAIEKSQKKWKCDVFEFARYFRAENPKIYRQIKWLEEYPDAIINVDATVTIVNKNLVDPDAKKMY